MSQKDLAAATGISRQAISYWESDRNLKQIEQALGLLAYLGATLIHNNGSEHLLQLTVTKRLADAIHNSGPIIHQDGHSSQASGRGESAENSVIL